MQDYRLHQPPRKPRQRLQLPYHHIALAHGPIVAERDQRDGHRFLVPQRSRFWHDADAHARFDHAAHRVEAA